MLESPLEYNGIVLNDQSQRGLATGKYFKVISATGLDDADVRDVRTARPGFDGELSSDSFYGGRSITLSGQLRARTLMDLRNMEAEIKEAFGDLRYHNLYFKPWGKPARFFRVRKTQKLEIPEVQDSANFWRSFTVGLRAEDPFAYGIVENVADFDFIGIRPNLRRYDIAGTPNERRFPKAYSSEGAGAAEVVNQGNYAAYPVTRIYGYIKNPILTNMTTGKRLVFSDLEIQDGSYIEINHKTGVIKWNGLDDNYSGFDIISSEFWTLAPGVNDLQLNALDWADTSHWQVIWRDTFL